MRRKHRCMRFQISFFFFVSKHAIYEQNNSLFLANRIFLWKSTKSEHRDVNGSRFRCSSLLCVCVCERNGFSINTKWTGTSESQHAFDRLISRVRRPNWKWMAQMNVWQTSGLIFVSWTIKHVAVTVFAVICTTWYFFYCNYVSQTSDAPKCLYKLHFESISEWWQRRSAGHFARVTNTPFRKNIRKLPEWAIGSCDTSDAPRISENGNDMNEKTFQVYLISKRFAGN